MNLFASAGEEAEPGALTRRARPRKRRGQAARWRRAHPLGSTRAGEGAGDGAMVAPSPCSLSVRRSVLAALRRKNEAKREKREGRMR